MQTPMTDDPSMAPGGAAQQASEPPGDDTGGQEPAQDEAEPPSQQDTGAQQQASPEEQAQYNQFVGRAMELIYNQKMFPQVVEMLRGSGGGQAQKAAAQAPEPAGDDTGGPEPAGDEAEPPKGAAADSSSAQGLAHATAMIITRVYKAASDAGAQLSPDVLFHGGTEIFGQLAEISDKAGISNYAKNRDGLEGAYFLAIDTATKQLRSAGVVDEAESKAALQQLHDMDAKGELEGVFRELDAKDQAGNAGAQPQSPQPPPSADDTQAPTQGGMAPQEMN